MATLIKCPGCGQALSVSNKRTKCGKCGTVISLRVHGLPARKTKRKRPFRLDSVVRKLLTNPYFIIVVMVFAAYVFGLFR